MNAFVAPHTRGAAPTITSDAFVAHGVDVSDTVVVSYAA